MCNSVTFDWPASALTYSLSHSLFILKKQERRLVKEGGREKTRGVPGSRTREIRGEEVSGKGK